VAQLSILGVFSAYENIHTQMVGHGTYRSFALDRMACRDAGYFPEDLGGYDDIFIRFYDGDLIGLYDSVAALVADHFAHWHYRRVVVIDLAET
jgi:hypothetical protein